MRETDVEILTLHLATRCQLASTWEGEEDSENCFVCLKVPLGYLHEAEAAPES